MNPRDRTVRLVLLAAFSALLPLIVVEVGMQLHHKEVRTKSWYRHSDDPRRIFERKPNAALGVNSLGFRDREHAKEKPEGVFRIVVLGDSVTNGYGVSTSERYSTLLEASLNATGERFEVLNFGTNQYSTPQEVAALEDVGLGMSPDLVILAYVLNDPISDGSINGFFLRDRSASLLAHWLVRRVESIVDRSAPEERRTVLGYYTQIHFDEGRWATVTRAFDSLQKTAEQHEFDVLLVIFPLLQVGAEATFDAYPGALAHQRVAEAGEHRNFQVLDLLSVFADYRPAELLISPRDPLHPNALGHRLAADAIHREIVGQASRRN